MIRLATFIRAPTARSRVSADARALFILLAGLAAWPQHGAQASSCDLRLNVTSVNLVWGLNFSTQQINFTISKMKQPACTYAVTFSNGVNTPPSDYNRRMRSGSNTLSYQLYKESSASNVLKEYPDVTSNNDVITGSFAQGGDQTQTLTYFLQIPYNLATQPVLKAPGQYTDSFLLKAYALPTNANGNTQSPDATANVSLTTTIARIIQLSLVPPGAGFDPNSTAQVLNFGTLTEGASLGFDMRALSNAGYAISFSSQNNGALKLAGAQSTASTTVPYSLTVGSMPKNLVGSQTHPVIVATGSGQTSTAGAVNTVFVTIGSVADKMAGSYSDNITVTATTTE